MKKVRVTWVKSLIGAKPKHRKTIEVLGLRRLGHTVEKELNPAIQGMIDSVSHLVRVEDAN